jgi:hypothetical protein
MNEPIKSVYDRLLWQIDRAWSRDYDERESWWLQFDLLWARSPYVGGTLFAIARRKYYQQKRFEEFWARQRMLRWMARSKGTINKI